jgi:hypothetical protein
MEFPSMATLFGSGGEGVGERPSTTKAGTSSNAACSPTETNSAATGCSVGVTATLISGTDTVVGGQVPEQLSA